MRRRSRTGAWHPNAIGDAVREQVARFGPDAALGPLVRAWPEAVGEAIADNAWPARIARDGTLLVHTSSSVWAFELTALEATMVEQLRASLGDAAPAAIRFAPGRLPERGPHPEQADPAPPLAVSREHEEAAQEIAAGIESEPLREAVARAAAASLARSEARPDDRPL
jgi:predicted nucleic acid-binding Zn ribbon protein